MSFKISELNAFSNAKLGTSDDAIANISGNGGKIVQKNEYYGGIGKIFRLPRAKAANNAVRTELLRALGKAFGIDGVGNNSAGKTTFSQKFMDRLSELLGDDFKRDDFGIARDGTVKSGKPLTQRRIKAILKRATLVGQSDHRDYSCEATKAKYDYVSAKIESFPKNSCVHSHFALVKKIMGFIETELPNLITDNYMFDRSKPVSMQNKAGDIHVTDNKGQVSLRPLLKVDDVRAYLEERLGVQVHINDNIIQGKRNVLIDALENPWRQILDYVNKVLKTFVLESLDMFIEAESKGVEGNFADAIGGVCLEARTNFLMNFKATYLLDSGPATLHDATMSLEKCMGQEIKLLIEHEPDDSKKTWNNVAARVKEKLVGEVRPICTAEVTKEKNGEISSVKYKPVLDIDGKPVVREITEEDIDEIGEAVMATIIDGV